MFARRFRIGNLFGANYNMQVTLLPPFRLGRLPVVRSNHSERAAQYISIDKSWHVLLHDYLYRNDAIEVFALVVKLDLRLTPALFVSRTCHEFVRAGLVDFPQI